MKLTKILLVYIGIAGLLAASCGDLTTEIQWDTHKVPAMLIVEGEVTDELTHHTITLKQADDYFCNKPLNGVSGASLVVTDGTANYTFTENPQNPGQYISDSLFAGVPGASYTLDVHLDKPIDQKDAFTANALLPVPFPIDTVVCSVYENFDIEEDGDSLILVIGVVALMPLQGNRFFMMDLVHNGVRLTDTITDRILFNNEYYDGQTAFYMAASFEIPVGDTIEVEISSVTENYFDFVVGVWNITYPVDPFGFSGPQANVKGNISNGQGLGYFNARSIVRKKAIVQDLR